MMRHCGDTFNDRVARLLFGGARQPAALSGVRSLTLLPPAGHAFWKQPGAPEMAIKTTLELELERNEALDKLDKALCNVTRLTTEGVKSERQARELRETVSKLEAELRSGRSGGASTSAPMSPPAPAPGGASNQGSSTGPAWAQRSPGKTGDGPGSTVVTTLQDPRVPLQTQPAHTRPPPAPEGGGSPQPPDSGDIEKIEMRRKLSDLERVLHIAMSDVLKERERCEDLQRKLNSKTGELEAKRLQSVVDMEERVRVVEAAAGHLSAEGGDKPITPRAEGGRPDGGLLLAGMDGDAWEALKLERVRNRKTAEHALQLQHKAQQDIASLKEDLYREQRRAADLVTAHRSAEAEHQVTHAELRRANARAVELEAHLGALQREVDRLRAFAPSSELRQMHQGPRPATHTPSPEPPRGVSPANGARMHTPSPEPQLARGGWAVSSPASPLRPGEQAPLSGAQVLLPSGPTASPAQHQALPQQNGARAPAEYNIASPLKPMTPSLQQRSPLVPAAADAAQGDGAADATVMLRPDPLLSRPPGPAAARLSRIIRASSAPVAEMPHDSGGDGEVR